MSNQSVSLLSTLLAFPPVLAATADSLDEATNEKDHDFEFNASLDVIG